MHESNFLSIFSAKSSILPMRKNTCSKLTIETLEQDVKYVQN